MDFIYSGITCTELHIKRTRLFQLFIDCHINYSVHNKSFRHNCHTCLFPLVRFTNKKPVEYIYYKMNTVAYQKAQLHEIILAGLKVKPGVQHRKWGVAAH